jgi:hypothetical protein
MLWRLIFGRSEVGVGCFRSRERQNGFPNHYRCTIYIVRRTQLYLDQQIWDVLHARARRENTTVSELVRQAVRERYLGNREQRMTAMQRLVGIRKHPAETTAVSEVQGLRRGVRLNRLGER